MGWGDSVFAFLEQLFGLFTHKETAFTLSGGLFVALVVFMVWFGFVIGRPISELRRLVAELERLSSGRDFVDAYPKISERMRASRLAHAWQEFDKTVLKPESGKPAIVRITARPGDYLNREMCGLNFPVWHALPNYFVGVGLLLTFFGLVAALYFASGAVGGDVQKATKSLEDLLGAATFKFLTSICGLLSSIVFSLLYHKGVKQLDRAFEELCEQIERVTEWASPELIADRQLQQLERQTAELERFNQNIAMEIADGLASRLDASIAEGLRRAIEPLSDAVERLANRLGDHNLDAIQQMVQAFQKQLQAGAGGEMREVAQALAELRQSLRGVGETFARQAQGFGEQLDAATRRLGEVAETMTSRVHEGLANATGELRKEIEGAANQMGTSLDKSANDFATRLSEAANRLTATLGPLSEPLGRFVTSLDTLDTRLAEQANRFQEVSAGARSVANAVADAAGMMQRAGAPAEAAATKMLEAIEGMTATAESLEATRQGLDGLGERLTGLVGTLEHSWQAYAGRFDQIDRTLERVFDKFVKDTEAYEAVVHDFNKDLAEHLNNAVKSLGAGVEQLGDKIDELGDTLDRNGPARRAAE